MNTRTRSFGLSRLTLAVALTTAALAGLGAGCYDPNLGDNPWTCSQDQRIPECPEEYSCVQGVCVKDTASGTPTDAGTDAGGVSRLPDPANCPDKDVEPNEDKTKAIPIGFGRSVNWAICTASDKDYFKIELAKGQQMQVKLKYQPLSNNQNHLDIVFFGGTTLETMPTKSVLDKDDMGKVVGRTLGAKGDTTMALKDTFYLKVTTLASDAMNPGGPNFYNLEIIPVR